MANAVVVRISMCWLAGQLPEARFSPVLHWLHRQDINCVRKCALFKVQSLLLPPACFCA
jgi:hypothetical protein